MNIPLLCVATSVAFLCGAFSVLAYQFRKLRKLVATVVDGTHKVFEAQNTFNQIVVADLQTMTEVKAKK